jgi:hypothetical protein
MSEARNILNAVYFADQTDQQESSFIIHHNFEDLCWSGKFEIIDEVLKSVDLKLVSTTVMRSLLSASYWASDELIERDALFDRIMPEMIRRRGEDIAHRLLDLLDSRRKL